MILIGAQQSTAPLPSNTIFYLFILHTQHTEAVVAAANVYAVCM
jgi:hypothetical protein